MYDHNAPLTIKGPEQQEITDELAIIQRLLPLQGARILELGCGAADKTRQIAQETGVCSIVAAEVDQIQHAKNLQIDDLPGVTFASFGAEEINAEDDSFDIVLMFKSLHHVREELLPQALAEIRRVLQPGGLLYVSEPVFDGPFNEVIRLFHDEEHVRQIAFKALVDALESDQFELVEEVFFSNIVQLRDFSQFEKGILNATFLDHDPSAEVLAEVRSRFERNRSDAGYVFEVPNRVDLLRKPAAPRPTDALN